MLNFQLSRGFGVLAFGTALVSAACGASYLATCFGSYTVSLSPTVHVLLTATPLWTGSDEELGSYFTNSVGTYTRPFPKGTPLPQVLTGKWTTQTRGNSGVNGEAESSADFTYLITLTNLSPLPTYYAFSFNFSQAAKFATSGPGQFATVTSDFSASQSLSTGAVTSVSNNIDLSSITNGAGKTVVTVEKDYFSRAMRGREVDTILIASAQSGIASSVPEPSPMCVAVFGVAGLTLRRARMLEKTRRG